MHCIENTREVGDLISRCKVGGRLPIHCYEIILDGFSFDSSICYRTLTLEGSHLIYCDETTQDAWLFHILDIN